MVSTATADGDVHEDLRKPLAVVGAGNWLVTHDRVGPQVLDALRERPPGPDVALIQVGSTGLGLLDCIHGQQLMLVVDACVLGDDPGQIRVVEPSLDSPASPVTSAHQIGPLETLTVAKLLYPETLPRQIRFILVETRNMDEDMEQAACRQVVSIIEREIAQWRSQQRSLGHPSQASDSPH